MNAPAAAFLVTVSSDVLAPAIADSALAVLTQKGLLDAIAASGVDVAALVREIGRNAAMCVVCEAVET